MGFEMFLKKSLISAVSIISLLSSPLHAGKTTDDESITVPTPQSFLPQTIIALTYEDYQPHIKAMRDANETIGKMWRGRVDASNKFTGWTDEDVTFFCAHSLKAMREEHTSRNGFRQKYHPAGTFDEPSAEFSHVEVTITKRDANVPILRTGITPLAEFETFVKRHIPRDQTHTLWIAPLFMGFINAIQDSLLNDLRFKPDPDMYKSAYSHAEPIEDIAQKAAQLEFLAEKHLQTWVQSLHKVFTDMGLFRYSCFIPVKLIPAKRNPLDAWRNEAFQAPWVWNPQFQQSDGEKLKMLDLSIQFNTIQQQLYETLLSHGLDFQMIYQALGKTPQIPHPVPYEVNDSSQQPLKLKGIQFPLHISVPFGAEFKMAFDNIKRIEDLVKTNRRRNDGQLGPWNQTEKDSLKSIILEYTQSAYEEKVRMNESLPAFFKRPLSAEGNPLPSSRLKYRVTAEFVPDAPNTNSQKADASESHYSHQDNPALSLEKAQLSEFLDGPNVVRPPNSRNDTRHVEAFHAIRYYLEVLIRRSIYMAVVPALDVEHFRREHEDSPFMQRILTAAQRTLRQTQKIGVIDKFLKPFLRECKWFNLDRLRLQSAADQHQRHFSFDTPYPEGDWRRVYKKIKASSSNSTVTKKDAVTYSQSLDLIRNWEFFRTTVGAVALQYGFMDWTPVSRALGYNSYFPEIPLLRGPIQAWRLSETDISQLRRLKKDFETIVTIAKKRAVRIRGQKAISHFNLQQGDYEVCARVLLENLRHRARLHESEQQSFFGHTPFAHFQPRFSNGTVAFRFADESKERTCNATVPKMVKHLKAHYPKDAPSVVLGALFTTIGEQLKWAAFRPNANACMIFSEIEKFSKHDTLGILRSSEEISEASGLLAGDFSNRCIKFAKKNGIVPHDINTILGIRHTPMESDITLQNTEPFVEEGRQKRAETIHKMTGDSKIDLILLTLEEQHFDLSKTRTIVGSFQKLIPPAPSVFSQQDEGSSSSSSTSSSSTSSGVSSAKKPPLKKTVTPSQEEKDQAERIRLEQVQKQEARKQATLKAEEARRQAAQQAEEKRKQTEEEARFETERSAAQTTTTHVESSHVYQPTPKEAQMQRVKEMLAAKKAESQRLVAQQNAARIKNAGRNRLAAEKRATQKRTLESTASTVMEEKKKAVSAAQPTPSQEDEEITRTLQRAAAKKAEEERLKNQEQERIAEQNRAARAEQNRLKKEKKNTKAEAKRLAKIEADRIEAERLAKIEADRIEAERLAKIEAERIEAERLAKVEADRIEAERLAKIKAEQAEAERLATIEMERLERERRAKAEADRIAAEHQARIDANMAKFLSSATKVNHDLRNTTTDLDGDKNLTLSRHVSDSSQVPVQKRKMTPAFKKALIDDFNRHHKTEQDPINVEAMFNNPHMRKKLILDFQKRLAKQNFKASSVEITKRMKLAEMLHRLKKAEETEGALRTFADESKD